MQGTQKKFMLLLFIVIIGCLGSPPVTLHFLVPHQQINVAHQINVPPVKPTAPAYTDGQCTADTLTQVQPSSKPVTLPPSLSAIWPKVGYTRQDYTNALQCATAFVNLYESFDYHQIQSLYTAIPLLSADAKQRFYYGYSSTGANQRTTQAWENQIKTNQMVQQAKPSAATLESYTDQNHEFFLAFSIPSQLIERVEAKQTTQNITVTLLLKKVQPNSNMHGVGWQVSDWRENGVAE